MQPEIVAAVVAFLAGAAVTAFALRWRRRAEVTSGPPDDLASPHLETDISWPADLPAVVDQLDIGLMRIDETRRVVRLNRAAARILHVDGRVIGRSLLETFVDHRVDELAILAGQSASATLELVLRNAEERRIAVRFRRATGGGGWLILDDLTELRRLQRIRSEFIDNLSHELRTPLTTIRLLTETLTQDVERTEVDVPPRVRDKILKIDVETGHLVQMVNELLDLSRIEGGAAELSFHNVQLADVIQGTLDRLRTFADRQRVGLEADFGDGGLPVVWGDEERLGQVLINLLHNAVKFSPPESIVAVTVRTEDDHVTVTVRDEGVGIPREDLDRVFERFYKVDKARQRGQGGTGLGLAIARHIIEGHGGRIWVESDEGRGSAFKFMVPIARDEASDHTARRPS